MKSKSTRMALVAFLLVAAATLDYKAVAFSCRPSMIISRSSAAVASPLFAKRQRRPETSPSSGPKGESAVRRRRSSPAAVTPKRAPHQFDHTKSDARPFIDAKTEVHGQNPSEDAPAYDLGGESLVDQHVETFALDDLFPNLDFSKQFAESTEFRQRLRNAMRTDVFHSTPAYSGLSEKAQKMLLMPDSSLQGSWKCNDEPRMKELTGVLREYLGPDAPTGDDFMNTIGSLCGPEASTHWLDIVGISDRRMGHSWQQDTGQGANCKTVLLGFPPEDDYTGVGVFSHLVKLKHEKWARKGHPPKQPVLFSKEVDDEYVVRPCYGKGRELIAYRDVDVLHSAPDVTYRESVMKFI